MATNMPRSSSSTVEEENEKKGIDPKRNVVIILDKVNGFQYVLGDEFRAIEAQKMERRRHVPWIFRANEVLATWIGIQMGITPHVHILNN